MNGHPVLLPAEAKENHLAQLRWCRLGARVLQALHQLRQTPTMSMTPFLCQAGHFVSTCEVTGLQATPVQAFGLKPLSDLSSIELQQELSAHHLDVNGATVAQMKERLRRIRGEAVGRTTSLPGLSAMEREILTQNTAQVNLVSVRAAVSTLRMVIHRWDAAAASASQGSAPAVSTAPPDFGDIGHYTGETFRNKLVTACLGFLEANGVVPLMEPHADLEKTHQPSGLEFFSTM